MAGPFEGSINEVGTLGYARGLLATCGVIRLSMCPRSENLADLPSQSLLGFLESLERAVVVFLGSLLTPKTSSRQFSRTWNNHSSIESIETDETAGQFGWWTNLWQVGQLMSILVRVPPLPLGQTRLQAT